MPEDYKYFIEQGPISQWLYRRIAPAEGWYRWSFSQVDWVYWEPFDQNPLREINADEAHRFVLDGYSKRANNYADRAVYVQRN